MNRWNRQVQARMERTVWNSGGCTSWYLDAQGRNTTVWPGTTGEFRRETRSVDLAEYEVLRVGSASGSRPLPLRLPRGPVRRRCPGLCPRTRAPHTPAGPESPERPRTSREPADARPLRALRSARRAAEFVAVSADGARLHVEVHGDQDAPTVVLAHGWTCSTAFWAAQIRALAATHRVVAYDQRGHGRSPAARAHSTTALADDLVAVLEAVLAPGERAVVAGHSMGGMTIMAAAGRPEFGERVAAALLCSTGSSRLAAEALVLPVRAGRVRTRVTGAFLGSRAPWDRSRRSPGRS